MNRQETEKMNYENIQRGILPDNKKNDFQCYPRKLSVDNFTIPKFQMRLATNQGNPKQLATLIATKETTPSRCLQSSSEHCYFGASEQATEAPKEEETSIAFNQRNITVHLQDVQQSSLLRRRRQNQTGGESKREVKGSQALNTTDASLALKQCPFQDNNCDMTIRLHDVEESNSTILRRRRKNQTRGGLQTGLYFSQYFSQTSFQEVICPPVKSPCKSICMVSSLEEKIVIQSPITSPCNRFEMVSSLEEKIVIQSPITSPCDGTEIDSSLEEQIAIQSPLTPSYDRFEMVSSLEELIVIHSPLSSPCDGTGMNSALEENTNSPTERTVGLEEKITLHSPLKSPSYRTEMDSTLEEMIFIQWSMKSQCDRGGMVSSFEEKIVIHSPLKSPNGKPYSFEEKPRDQTKSPCDPTGMTFRYERTVIQSPPTSPCDRFEMVSSLEERIVIQSPLTSSPDRAEMGSSLEEVIVQTDSPLKSPCDRFEMVSIPKGSFLSHH